MNRYEMVNIIDVNWGEGDPARAQKMIAEEIAGAGGELDDSGTMGRRRLAYPVNNHTEGLYLVSHFRHSPEGLVPLRDSLKLNTAVLRTLLVRYDGQGPLPPGMRAPQESEPANGGETEPEGEPVSERENPGEDSGKPNCH